MCSSSARLLRAFFSRMVLALAVHLKGFGLVLRSTSQVSMATSSSATLLKTPRRICWPVISANSRSTRLIQDDDVGVKCSHRLGGHQKTGDRSSILERGAHHLS